MAETVQLKTFKVSGAKPAGKLPSRIKVLGWGRNETSEGPVIVDEKTVQVFAANQKRIGRERVALDYEHNTVPGSPEFERTREPRDIAGNLTLTVVPGEGVFGEALTYTSTGEAKAENYEDLSLAPYTDDENRVIAAHSVALTRAGASYGITFSEAQKLSAADLKILSANQSPNTTMKNLKDPITGEQLAELLGLNPAAITVDTLKSTLGGLIVLSSIVTIDAGKITKLAGVDLTDGKIVVLSAIDGRLKKVEDAGTKAVATLSATIDGKVHTFNAEDVVRVVGRLDALELKIKDSEALAQDGERGKLIALFASDGKVPKNADGKVYTADDLKKLDVPTLRLLHANTPVTVALNARQGTLSAGDGKQFVEKDSTGKIIRVDMAAIYDSEAQQRGTARPA